MVAIQGAVSALACNLQHELPEHGGGRLLFRIYPYTLKGLIVINAFGPKDPII